MVNETNEQITVNPPIYNPATGAYTFEIPAGYGLYDYLKNIHFVYDFKFGEAIEPKEKKLTKSQMKKHLGIKKKYNRNI